MVGRTNFLTWAQKENDLAPHHDNEQILSSKSRLRLISKQIRLFYGFYPSRCLLLKVLWGLKSLRVTFPTRKFKPMGEICMFALCTLYFHRFMFCLSHYGHFSPLSFWLSNNLLNCPSQLPPLSRIKKRKVLPFRGLVSKVQRFVLKLK